MQVRMNKDIREYSESVFLGLSVRQLLFSAMAAASAVIAYFAFRDRLGTETTSWICMLVAAPFAFLGFFKYHGMSAERFLAAFIKSEVLEPKVLVLRPENAYFMALKGIRKEDRRKKDDKIRKDKVCAGEGTI